MPTSRRDFLRRLAGSAAGLSILRGEAAALDATPLRPLRGRRIDEPFWEEVKARFPLKEGIIPLNAANLAPAPQTVIDTVTATIRDLEADVSAQNRAKFSAIQEEARSRMAAYMGASPDEIALVRNASEANNIIVGGLDLGAGDEVVILDENHQTNNVAWTVRAARYGFTVRMLSLPSELRSPAQILETFVSAMSPTTRVVTFSDLSNISGVQLPTREICRAARERGIYVHVDGAQTLGAAVRNMGDLGCDSYSASAHKWLMGPKESGVLYVRADRVDEIWPNVVGVGWGSGAETTAEGARKLETLGQRNDATIAALIPMIDLHEELGREVVAARIMELATLLKDGIARIPGAQLVTPRSPELSGGVVITSFPGKDIRAIYNSLYDDYGVAGATTGGIRLCPHVYTTRDDIERTVEALERAAT